MSGFIAGLVVGSVLSSGSGGDSSPQVTTYQAPPNSEVFVCSEELRGDKCHEAGTGFSSPPIYYDPITWACHRLKDEGKSCVDYYVSNKFLIFNNGYLRSIMIEFTHVPEKRQ